MYTAATMRKITISLPGDLVDFADQQVVIEPHESDLSVRSAVNCAQIATIQQSGKESRFRAPRGATVLQPIGRLSATKMAEVDAALLFNLGIKTS